MLNELKQMIEIQSLWDKVHYDKTQIADAEKTIVASGKKYNDLKALLKRKNDELLALKVALKDLEINLIQIEEKKVKAQEKKNNASSTREIKAADNEYSTLYADMEEIEEKILNGYDEVSNHEAEILNIKENFEKEEKLFEEISSVNTERINRFKLIESDDRKKYSELADSFVDPHKGKFIKMLESANGKAICEVQNSKCSGCSYNLPADYKSKLENHNTILICQNCGKFIYQK